MRTRAASKRAVSSLARLIRSPGLTRMPTSILGTAAVLWPVRPLSMPAVVAPHPVRHALEDVDVGHAVQVDALARQDEVDELLGRVVGLRRDRESLGSASHCRRSAPAVAP